MAVTLLDIADVGEPVEIRGKTYVVSGVTSEVLVEMLARMPELRILISGKELDEDLKTSLLDSAPENVAAIVAAAMGADWRNPANVDMVRKLTAGEMMQVLEIAIRLTFPQGAANFIEGLNRLASVRGGPIKEAATKSQD